MTAESLTDLVPVGDTGEVVSWTWVAEPREGQPFDRPFAWALVRLDGADTPMLHALDVASPNDVSVGQQVRVVWAEVRTGAITDFHFAPAGDDSTAVSYTHLRAHETVLDLVCRLLLEKKTSNNYYQRMSNQYHYTHTYLEHNHLRTYD